MKELKLTTEEAVNYLKENVKIHDKIEISYNRVFAEGEVLNMDFSEYFGEPGFKMLVSLDESQIGSTVEIRYIADNEVETYYIVGSTEADPFENKISNESPIAKGIMGKKKGTIVTIESPNGNYDIEIVSLK